MAHPTRTRSSIKDIVNHCAFISKLEPKVFKEAENDEHWVMAMQEELNQFERSKVWTLVSPPKD
ncbi:hypothetical protein R6M70_14520, partial [Staphylococcus aureus]